MSDITEISVDEFWKLGFVQEINRLLLHPCGLALSVAVEGGKAVGFGEIWDYRDDPEGIYFAADGPDPDKAASVQKLIDGHAEARKADLGYVVQPIASEEPSAS